MATCSSALLINFGSRASANCKLHYLLTWCRLNTGCMSCNLYIVSSFTILLQQSSISSPLLTCNQFSDTRIPWECVPQLQLKGIIFLRQPIWPLDQLSFLVAGKNLLGLLFDVLGSLFGTCIISPGSAPCLIPCVWNGALQTLKAIAIFCA